MSDQPQPQFVILHSGIQSQPPAVPVSTVPERVRVAMEFLSYARDKHSFRFAHEMSQHEGFMQGAGQKLTNEEWDTHGVAAKVISDYLQGRLKLTKAEQQGLGDFRMNIPCPVCGQSPHLRNACTICAGKGQVRLTRLE